MLLWQANLCAVASRSTIIDVLCLLAGPEEAKNADFCINIWYGILFCSSFIGIVAVSAKMYVSSDGEEADAVSQPGLVGDLEMGHVRADILFELDAGIADTEQLRSRVGNDTLTT